MGPERKHISYQYRMDFQVAFEIFMGLLVAGLGTIGLFQIGGRYLIKYRIDDKAVRILFFGVLSMKSVALKDIREVKRLSPKELYCDTFVLRSPEMFFAQRWGNRFWGEGVLISKKAGLFKNVLLTPDDVGTFVQTIQERTGTSPASPTPSQMGPGQAGGR